MKQSVSSMYKHNRPLNHLKKGEITMKKLSVGVVLTIALVFGFSNSVMAQCADAEFLCKDAHGNLLGTVSVASSFQQPMLAQHPMCLPNFNLFSPCPSVDLCKKTYPATREACSVEKYPVNWGFSGCSRCGFWKRIYNQWRKIFLQGVFHKNRWRNGDGLFIRQNMFTALGCLKTDFWGRFFARKIDLSEMSNHRRRYAGAKNFSPLQGCPKPGKRIIAF